MRYWSQFSPEEQNLYRRISDAQLYLLPAQERYELEKIKIEMMCQPLEDSEIEGANEILHALKIIKGLNAAGQHYFMGER